MIRTAICEMLGIRYPVFQGGMAWIADGHLAAAVSAGGGLGIIAAGNAPGEYVREQIREARKITDKPIGVNIMLLSPFADEVAEVVAEENVQVVTTGAGNPSGYMRSWIDVGIKVIPVVASVGMARLMTRLGASALIAEGGESGGHVGELTTMVLVPQICDALTELLAPLPVSKVEVLAYPSEADCQSYIGMSGAELADEGFSFIMLRDRATETECTAQLGSFQYVIVFDGTVEDKNTADIAGAVENLTAKSVEVDCLTWDALVAE